MSLDTEPNTQTNGAVTTRTSRLLWQSVRILLIVIGFLLALDVMQASLALFGADYLRGQITEIVNNPFIALFLGMLVTALIQSSSTTTTMIVSLVVTGSLDPVSATPMIMGANVGTSVTSTLVSLGFIGYKDEYRRAIAAASVHNFFNIITVLVLFPIELMTRALSSTASGIASFLPAQAANGFELFDSLNFISRPIIDGLFRLTANEALPEGNPYLLLPLAIAFLFLMLQLLTQQLRNVVIGRVRRRLNRLIFGRPIRSLLTGTIITAGIQSSSATTSLVVPLVASRKVSLGHAFPFVMGANVGTTLTALLAALFLGAKTSSGLSAAFIHLLFNLIGVLLLFPVPAIRNYPVRLAKKLGELTLRNRLYGVGYVVVVFFLLPGLLIFLY